MAASPRTLFALMFRVKPHQQLVNHQTRGDAAKCRNSHPWVIVAGLAGTLAFGVFVITGQVATSVSGPAMVPSLLIAAVASLLAGLCLAEFVTSQPQPTISLYSSCYYSVGELIAFLVGWIVVLYHMAALATVCRAQSATIDYIVGNEIQNVISRVFGRVSYLHSIPDFLAVGLVLAPSILVALGLRQSKWASCILLVVTASTALFFVVLGALYSDTSNWSHSAGFLSRGPSGLLSGAAICVNAFLGPHVIPALGAATQRPHRHIPLAIGMSSTVSFLLCFAVAIVLTLLVRYDELRTTVPLIEAFEIRDVGWARYVMAGCAMISLAILSLETSFPIHQTVVLMSSDGLVFRSLSKTWQMTGAPAASILLFGAFSAVMALLLDIMDLLKITASAPLVVNTVICFVVLLRRYQPSDTWHYQPVLANGSTSRKRKSKSSDRGKSKTPSDGKQANQDTVSVEGDTCQLILEQDREVQESPLWLPPSPSDTSSNEADSNSDESSETDVDAIVDEYREKLRVAALTHIDGPSTSNLIQEPTPVTWRRVVLAVSCLIIAFLILSLLFTLGSECLETAQPLWLAVAALATLCVGCMMIIVARQPQNSSSALGWTRVGFHVPLLPWIPALASFINMCLFVELLGRTWMPLLIWMGAGLCIYFVYGIHSSTAASDFPPSSPQQQISLQPLPQHGNECVPHIVPSHRANTRSERRLAEVDTVLIQH